MVMAVESPRSLAGLEAVRDDFPILAKRIHGRPLVYLDSAATSQKPRQVIEALVAYYERSNANIHRGVYTLAEQATERYEAVRGKVAHFIGAATPRGIVFTRNTTEGINLVARAWGQANVGPGDEIVLTEMEHHSNIVPWQLLARERGARLRFAEVGPDGTLDLDQLGDLIGERTKLVAMTHVSNVLGTINPVAEVGRLAHRVGALLLVDGAQSVPHMPVDVRTLGCDFLAFSSHKMLGPTGVGVLYGREELLDAMPPFLAGGDMIDEVGLEHSTWNELPWKYEAGTPNIADVIAFGAAIDYLSALGMDRIRAHEHELTAYAFDVLGRVADVTLYGPRDLSIRGGVISFNVGDVHPHDVATVLDHEGIAIRVGQHCCQPLMRKLDLPGTARASFYLYNTRAEVDALAEGIERVRQVLGMKSCRPGA
jgi:cysteine desulfurase/selenocysteine lyase